MFMEYDSTKYFVNIYVKYCKSSKVIWEEN